MRTPHNDPRLTSDPDSSTRRCILSGAHGDRAALIRLALAPDGGLVPDVMARAPGRGAWIAVDRVTLAQAMTKGKLKGALARAFKGEPVHVAADLPDRIDAALRRETLALLGLAAKSGVLISGAERVDSAARSGAVMLLAHASDAADDGRRKRDQSWRVGEDAEGTGKAGRVLPIDRVALGHALGRDAAVHIALIDAGWADRIGMLLDRWQRFAGCATGDTAVATNDEDIPAAEPAAAGSLAAAQRTTGLK